MKSIIALTTVLALSTVTLGRRAAPHAVIMENQDQLQDDQTFYYMQGVRGMWLGLEHGLFKTKDGETCLDDETTKNLLKVITTIENRDFAKFQRLIPQVMEIYNNLLDCPTINEVRQLEVWCSEDITRCSSATIIANVQKNMFQIMGKMTDLSSIVQEFPAETADEVYTQTYQIGDDLGQVARSIMGLDEKKAKKDDKKKPEEKPAVKPADKPKNDKKKPDGHKFL